MNITFHIKSMSYFIDRMRSRRFFSLVGYSDAEWFCMLKHDLGSTSGLGQIFDSKTGDRLLDVLIRRHQDDSFLVSVPSCLFFLPHTVNFAEQLMTALESVGIEEIEVYERDNLTDTLAMNADLHPLINQLQKMKVCIIGNEALRGLNFLGYRHFVEISSPNLHLEPEGIERAVEDARSYGRPAVYLVSAGVSAAVIIDQLHGTIPKSFFVDCGSIWDAFVGIGGQREWRACLYENPKRLEKWKHDNLHGKD